MAICPECHGEGYVERTDDHGYYQIPCPFCYESLGEVEGEE